MSFQKTIFQSIQSRIWLLILSTGIILMNSRTLGAEGQGQIAWIQLGVLLVTGASGFIAGGAVVFLQSRIALRTALLPGHIWLIISSFGASILGVAFGLLPAHRMLEIGVLGWLQGTVIFHGQLLLGEQFVREHNRLQVSQNAWTALGLAATYFVWNWQSVDAFLFVLGLSLGVTALLSLCWLRKLSKPEHSLPFRQVISLLWKHGSAAQSGSLLQMLTNRTNFSLLARSAENGAAATGVYSIAFYVLEAIWLVSRGLAPLVHSRTSHNPKQTQRIQETRQLLGIALLGTTVLAIFACSIPDTWYAFAVGFGGIQPIVVLLLPAAFSGTFASIISHHLSGIGQHKWNAFTSALGLVILIVLGSQWIPSHGIKGAAMAASVASVVQTTGLFWAWCHCEGTHGIHLFPKWSEIVAVFSSSQKSE